MADVARRAGVSTGTVSRALRDLPGVGEETRELIKATARELHYVVSPEASTLSRGATGRVAVVVPRIHVWFYAAMVSALERTFREHGLSVLLYQVDGEQQRLRFFRELPARRKVDAVVLVALPVLTDEAERLDVMGAEVVVAGGRIRDYPHVEVDDHGIALAAMEHLIGLGHRRIAMIRTSDSEGAYWSADAERTRGYHDALAAANLPADPAYMVVEPYAVEAGALAMRRLLDLRTPPTAVFAYSDELALAALRELQVAGVDVPGQVSLIGVDGHPTARLFGITTVDQDVERQGVLAARLVLDTLDGGRTRPAGKVPFRLAVRETTGPAPAETGRKRATATGRGTRRPRARRTPRSA
jgi:DNA-binding LacI/PurR family transcriptional regulator